MRNPWLSVLLKPNATVDIPVLLMTRAVKSIGALKHGLGPVESSAAFLKGGAYNGHHEGGQCASASRN